MDTSAGAADTIRIRQLEKENAELRAYRRRTQNALRNAALSPGQRITLLETLNELDSQRGHADASGAIPIVMQRIAGASGQSKASVSDHLKFLAACGAWRRDLHVNRDATGLARSELRLMPLDALARPDMLTPPTARNHGGKRIACPQCGSLRLVARRQIICCDCDSTVESHERPINPDAHALADGNTTGGHLDLRWQLIDASPVPPRLLPAPRPPATPTPEGNEHALADGSGSGDGDGDATGGHLDLRWAEPEGNEHALADGSGSGDGDATGGHLDLRWAEPEPAPLRAQPAPTITPLLNNQRGGGINPRYGGDSAWLVQLAGDGTRHLVMGAGGDKYQWRGGAVSPGLAMAHIRGDMTIGATLARADGQTLALCWDADSPESWAVLQGAALQLVASGAGALLESSPRRGGHLWLVFASPVHAGDALATALAHAPALATIGETWPNASQGLRLPGGRYVAPGVDAWPPVQAVADGETATGRDAIALMREHATPDSWVRAGAARSMPAALAAPPAAPGGPRQDAPNAPGGVVPPPSLVIYPDAPGGDSSAMPQPAALTDVRWLWQYGDQSRTLWFASTANEAAEWFNRGHTCQDLLPPERNGYGLASWRKEKTASVGYTDTGWVDYGAGGDGDAGDALELHCRITGASRGDALRVATRAMIMAARAELESAARAGVGVPAWVACIMTKAGWARYSALAPAS